MIRLKFHKTSDARGYNNDANRIFICMRGYAKFFGVPKYECEEEFDLCISRRELKGGYKFTLDYGDLEHDGELIGTLMSFDLFLSDNFEHGDTIYMRVEVDK